MTLGEDGRRPRPAGRDARPPLTSWTGSSRWLLEPLASPALCGLLWRMDPAAEFSDIPDSAELPGQAGPASRSTVPCESWRPHLFLSKLKRPDSGRARLYRLFS